MTDQYEFDIPVPPSANNYWRVANNRIVVTTEARNYKQQIFYQLSRKIDEPLRGDIAVNVTVFRPQKRGDLDNFLKIMLDALQGIIYLNDSQVVEIHAFRDDDKYNPHVRVLVYEVERK